MSIAAFTYVDSESLLNALTEAVAAAGRVALDTEANSLHNYYERVCLIQLSVGDVHSIVDPLAEIDVGGFLEALAKTELLIHGADYDLRLMRATFGFEPKNGVFDTMLAAQLLGMERVGYASLVEHFFDVQLSKAGQKSNWAKRPLTDAQLQYATDDTRFLGPLANLLKEELESRGRLAWHEEWCRRVVAATKEPSSRDAKDAWRIRGTGTLSRKQLAYLREFWRWRERQAERADVPPFKILGNQQLVELAIWATEHPKSEVENGPKLPRHVEGRRLQALKGAIKRARELPKDKWPERRKRQNRGPAGPECKPQIEALRTECARVAHELEIPPSVLAPKAMLVAIARNNARTAEEMQACSGMMDWQLELLKEPLRTALEQFDENE